LTVCLIACLLIVSDWHFVIVSKQLIDLDFDLNINAKTLSCNIATDSHLLTI
jgi:hypothetical protein